MSHLIVIPPLSCCQIIGSLGEAMSLFGPIADTAADYPHPFSKLVDIIYHTFIGHANGLSVFIHST
jgi:hypothetical protein